MSDPREGVEAWRLAELGREAAGLVHQLRQPIFAIKGLLQLAEAQPHSAPAHLAAAREQVEALERLVVGWSDLTRRPGADLQSFDVRAPVESALVLLRMRAAAVGVRVETDLGPGRLVYSSALGIQQAVMNLGQNAIDALEGREDFVHAGHEFDGAGHADGGIEFVDIAVGFDARVVLGDAAAAEQAGVAFVPRAGIDLHHHPNNLHDR